MHQKVVYLVRLVIRVYHISQCFCEMQLPQDA